MNKRILHPGGSILVLDTRILDEELNVIMQIELHTVMGNVLQSPKGNQLFVRLVERRTGAEEEWESLGADSGIDDCEI